MGPVWPDGEIKRCPNVSKSYPVWLKKPLFSEKSSQKSPNNKVTFVWKFGDEYFQNLPNLVKLHGTFLLSSLEKIISKVI